jgi:hypothetical protein
MSTINWRLRTGALSAPRRDLSGARTLGRESRNANQYEQNPHKNYAPVIFNGSID